MDNTLEFLVSVYKRPRITFAEVCECIGVTTETGYVMRCKKKFPIPMSRRRPMTADLRDVAKYLDEQSTS